MKADAERVPTASGARASGRAGRPFDAATIERIFREFTELGYSVQQIAEHPSE